MALPSGDRFANVTGGISDPGWDAFLAPSNTTFTATARALYIGGLGDVEVVTANGNTVKFSSVPTGTIIPIRCTKLTTNTTATFIVGFI
jgi:hypothetical protein